MQAQNIIYVIPKRSKVPSEKDLWRGNVTPFVKPIYVALKQNGKYRVFVEEKDLEKYPYIIPMTEDQFNERYEELAANLQALLRDDSGEPIHYLQHQSRSFVLTATIENIVGNDGESILGAGTELQASECAVIEGEVVGLQWVNWAPGSEQWRHRRRQEIVRVFVLHKHSSLLIIELIENRKKNEALIRGEAHQFEIFVDVSLEPTTSKFLRNLSLLGRSGHALKLTPGMISSFGACCRINFDSSIWGPKKAEDKNDAGRARAVLCLEFDMALVTEKDEEFIGSALKNTGIISSLIAGVAISTHFNPPGFQILRQSEDSLIANTDVIVINNALLTAFITLNSIALFSALASLVLSIVPQVFYGTKKEMAGLDGTLNLNLPHSMQKEYTANASPMALYKSKCRALNYSILLLGLSVFSLSAAIFVSGFLALFDNTWTMDFFIASFVLVFIILAYMVAVVFKDLHKGSVDTWAKKHRKAPLRCRQSLHELARQNAGQQIGVLFIDSKALLVDIDQIDGYGSTALHVAAGNGCEKALAALINCGASLQARDDTGRTPLYYAARQNNWQCVSVLLEKGADPNAKNDQDGTSALSRACEAGNVKSVEALLKDPRTIMAQQDSHGSTCLHWAVYGEVNPWDPCTGSKICFELILKELKSDRDKVLDLPGAGGFKAEELREEGKRHRWLQHY